MSMLRLALIAIILTCPQVNFGQESSDSLNEHLAAFKPLLGKVFKGEFVNSTPEKPQFDVSRWERAMNGQAIRILHSVNDGAYGGETIMMWDTKQKTIAYWYFTTAGFHTQGTMEISGRSWTSMEEVAGNANGITKVRAQSTLTDSGELHVKSEYFANDKWMPGHEIKYLPAPDAQVKFK